MDTLPPATPELYRVLITPSMTEDTFVGSATIDVLLEKPTSTIALHAADMIIHRVVVSEEAGGKEIVELTNVPIDEANEVLTLPLGSAVAGRVQVHVDYVGRIRRDMKGFYRCTYTDPTTGAPATVLATQFEPVDARRALPCFDLPHYKAPFILTLRVPPTMTAVANTEVESIVPVSATVTDVTFAETPKMSTYLLAWAIGVFESTERIIAKRGLKGHTRMRILSPIGRGRLTHYALDIACRVMPLYEEAFGCEYVLPKLDLIALPELSFSAMENWGLITYREQALLCDEHSSEAQRRIIAIIVAHELAHQWFGNLVTMRSWSELWLNESFATWMEYWVIDRLEPSWRIMHSFVADDTGRALSLDALDSTHPIEVPLTHPSQVSEIFDAISYAKGASIIRMLVRYIGESAFSEGLRAYIKENAFGNASTSDLWAHLSRASEKNLTATMAAWTTVAGYPYLTVSRPRPTEISISQRRFRSSIVEEESSTASWLVPLEFRVGSARHRYELCDREATISIPADATLIQFNLEAASFCRVHYDRATFEALAEGLRAGELSPLDRWALLSDYHALSRAGIASAVDLARLAMCIREERELCVWEVLTSIYCDLLMLLGDSPQSKRLTAWAAEQATEAAVAVLDTNEPLEGLLALQLVRWGWAPAVERVAALYATRQEVGLPAHLRLPAYISTLRRDPRGFEELWSTLASSEDPVERQDAIRALAGTHNESQATALLVLSLQNTLRAQEVATVLVAVGGWTHHAGLYASFLVSHWDEIATRLPGLLLNRVFAPLAGISDPAIADKLAAWWTALPQSKRDLADRALAQGVERVRRNAAWIARDGKALEQYLASLPE